jgi:hypothetical protein
MAADGVFSPLPPIEQVKIEISSYGQTGDGRTDKTGTANE